MKGRRLALPGSALVLALLVSGCTGLNQPTTSFSMSVSLTTTSGGVCYVLMPFKTPASEASSDLSKYFQTEGGMTVSHTVLNGTLFLNMSCSRSGSLSAEKDFTKYPDELAYKKKVWNPDYSFVPAEPYNESTGHGPQSIIMYTYFGGTRAPTITLSVSNGGISTTEHISLRNELKSGWCKYFISVARPME
jgi:hypothetical protein